MTTLERLNSKESLTISPKQVLAVVRCLIATHKGISEGKTITIQKKSAVVGKPPDESMDVEADGYKLGFKFRGGVVQDCHHCSTPSGKMWSQVKDGNSPLSQLNLEDIKYLSTMLLDRKEQEFRCEARRVWIVITNQERPYSSLIYHTKEEVDAAVDEQIGFHSKYSKTKTEVKEEEKEVKEQIKQANAVPFSTRRKK